jgi:hypothetical protein
MIDLPTARSLAAGEVPKGLQLDDTGFKELRTGWFFPYRDVDPDPERPLIGGPKGVIVNKHTGDRLELGSGMLPIGPDLAVYDKGYQFFYYDLVVTRIADMQRTLDTLETLHISVVEPTYAHGTVWRVARPLTRAELRSRVRELPHVFGGEPLGSYAEVLEKAREEGFFQFELLECR